MVKNRPSALGLTLDTSVDSEVVVNQNFREKEGADNTKVRVNIGKKKKSRLL